MQINHGALPLIMGNYASNFGINLYMYGAAAYTDGKNITIPRLNFNNPEEMDLAFGYVAHECGHVRYSDFDVFGKSYDKAGILPRIFNALEDTRIENLQIANWPGLRKTFNNIVGKLDESVCRYLKNCKNRASLITAFLDCSNRVRCLNQNSGNSLKAARTRLKKIIPETVIDAIEEKAAGSVNCRDSAEVLELSREILNIFMNCFELANDEYMRQKEADKESSEKAGNAGMFSESSWNGGRTSDSIECSEPLKIQGKTGAPFQTDLFDSVFNGSEGSSGANGGEAITSTEPKSHVEQSLGEYGEFLSEFGTGDVDGNGSRRRQKMIREFEKIIGRMKEPFSFSENSQCDRRHPDLATIIENCSAKSKGAVDIGSLVSRNSAPAKDLSLYRKVLNDNTLRADISHLVKGYEEWNYGAASSGRCLDVRRYQYTYGGKLSDDVFKKKSPRRALNTTVHLLVDISGSMSRPCRPDSKVTRSQVANHLALSLAMSLENVRNVDNRVIYFPGNCCEYEEVYRSGQSLVERATYFDLMPRGCTPLAQALLYSMSNMPSVDKYHRNIIIVITDGEPDNYDFATEMLNKAKGNNIEVYALRVAPNGDRLRTLFEESVDIGNASELPAALTELLAHKVFSYC